MNSCKHSNRFAIITNPSKEEIESVKKGLEEHNKKHPNGELDIPTPDISLVLKDKAGQIIGGVITSMLVGVMHLEVLWVDKTHRRKGYGRALVLEAERIGKKKGYTAAQTWTFSFQAPEFYQSIGYKVLGIFDGYTSGITEYVLMKRLDTTHDTLNETTRQGKAEFSISEDSSEESMNVLHTGLREYVLEHIGELRKKNPRIQINLIIKNAEGQVIGGLNGGSILKALYIDQLWIDERYRGQGYGKELMMVAEGIARKEGCISSLAMVYSFQAPEFFQKLGYEIFGVSDGYPKPIKEYYFVKKY
ncbi:MAG: GNAT family N-acetyltransferase [Candidatus Hermodarchaeota archaeon]|nr:GNAT family N-acetyltransferase [Candidatus Hermodarchaeota archaeon]